MVHLPWRVGVMESRTCACVHHAVRTPERPRLCCGAVAHAAPAECATLRGTGGRAQSSKPLEPPTLLQTALARSSGQRRLRRVLTLCRTVAAGPAGLPACRTGNVAKRPPPRGRLAVAQNWVALRRLAGAAAGYVRYCAREGRHTRPGIAASPHSQKSRVPAAPLLGVSPQSHRRLG